MHKNFCYRDRYQRYYNNNRTILWGSVWDGAKVSHRYIYIYMYYIFAWSKERKRVVVVFKN